MGLVIVSNRLPVVVEHDEQGWRSKPAAGGLVAALGPVLQKRGGVWVGWPGVVDVETGEIDALLGDYAKGVGFELHSVGLSAADVEGFYEGFSNQIIWPLFHDLQSLCNFRPEYWASYIHVRRAFAEVVLQAAGPDDIVWVQDFHLMGMGRRLRERGLTNPLGFFLHIPFPPPDIFCKLPWRLEVLEGLLHHDIIGFQTPRDLENFVDCVRRMLPAAQLRKRGAFVECLSSGRRCALGSFPIGVDYARLAQDAASDEVTQRMRQVRCDMPDQRIIVSVDRLDYTKGIPYRLRAFQLALERFPELHRKVTLLQVVIPSRESVPQYQELKAEIERLVTQVNGQFTQPGWVPVQHVFRSLEWHELLAYYRAADVGIVTPLKDGMNLVAKEYCACQIEGDGVLILSEFAGAAAQLRNDAVLVNPYDLDGVAGAIHYGVLLSGEKRRAAMQRLRGVVRRQDVFWWARRFLGAFNLLTAHDNAPPVQPAALPQPEVTA